jgi:F0F1-type ATP synthase membrane subunit c/vacuolar-type H+-ATPase subunit K
MPREIALILIFAFCVLGPAIVIAASGFASINALGRNPSAAPKVFTAMIVLIIFAEAIAVIALLILFQLFRSQ